MLFDNSPRGGETMINAAIVGLGWWGKTLVESAQGSDAIRFVAVGTRAVSPEIKTFADDQKLRVVEGFEALLTDKKLDAIVLATPHPIRRVGHRHARRSDDDRSQRFAAQAYPMARSSRRDALWRAHSPGRSCDRRHDRSVWPHRYCLLP